MFADDSIRDDPTPPAPPVTPTKLVRSPVKSSMIKSVGHDKELEILEVEFCNGDVWRYDGVSEVTWLKFVTAPSVGGFFHKHIKTHYTGTKITG